MRLQELSERAYGFRRVVSVRSRPSTCVRNPLGAASGLLVSLTHGPGSTAARESMIDGPIIGPSVGCQGLSGNLPSTSSGRGRLRLLQGIEELSHGVKISH